MSNPKAPSIAGDISSRTFYHWQGHSPEEIQAMKDAIAGKEPIDD